MELIIEDSGVGIPAESLPHIFDRFYRVPGVRGEKSPERGLGLGLSFVAWIVREHRGSIDVESKPGRERNSPFACRKAMSVRLSILWRKLKGCN